MAKEVEKREEAEGGETFQVKVSFKNKITRVTIKPGTKAKEVIEASRKALGFEDKHLVQSNGEELLPDDVVKKGDEIKIILALITFGANTIDGTDYVGKKVSEIRAEVGKALSLPEGRLITEVNQNRVRKGHVLEEGDKLEFVKRKGWKL